MAELCHRLHYKISRVQKHQQVITCDHIDRMKHQNSEMQSAHPDYMHG